MSAIYLDGDSTNTRSDNVRKNPLADFKSYSYYHALVVCNTSEAAAALTETTAPDAWQHPSTQYYQSTPQAYYHEDLGPWSPRLVNDDPNLKYCVLINGATDANYTISKVSYQTISGAGATNNDRMSSIALEGQIIVSEPRGITFLDLIARCCVAMGKDTAHVTYLLKTFFVGVNDNDEVQVITNISPLPFLIYDATGSFTEAGGTYELALVGTVNGVSRLPQYDRMVRAANIKAPTVQVAMTQLQQEVARTYNDMFTCVYKQVERSEQDLGYAPGELLNALKRVEYRIEVDPMYEDLLYAIPPRAQQLSDKGTCEDVGTVNTGPDMSIESAIHQIMQSCPRVEQDNVDGISKPATIRDVTVPAFTKMQYKIHTSVTSSIASAEAGTSYVVTYKVSPYPSPRSFLSADEETKKSLINPNTIHFDYLYTGKNIDILEFDMKVNFGLAYLQIASLTNTYKGQGEPVATVATLPDVKQIVLSQNRVKSNESANQMVDIPVFFSSNLELPAKRSTQNMNATAGMVYDMAKHSSIEVLDVSMKITGNLTLLNSALQSAQLDKTNPTEGVMDWGVVPTYAKVNIKMPLNSDDIGLFAGNYRYDSTGSQQGFTKDFWFKNHYFILGMEHVFEDGDFIQNLEMLGMPEPFEFDQQQTKAQSATFSSEVVECYDGRVGCSGASVNQPSAHTTARQQVANSPTVAQARSANIPHAPASDVDVAVVKTPAEDIIGWRRLTPAEKNAITRETLTSPISLSSFAAILSIESAGRSSATSQTGAVGLFQFTRSTWNEVMPTHRIPLEGTITPESDPRRNAQLSARATRTYLTKISNRMDGDTATTWLYAGHNLGSGIAPIIRKHAISGREIPLATVYEQNNISIAGKRGAAAWYEFAANNGYDRSTTTLTLQSQIAGKLVKQLPSTVASTIKNTGSFSIPRQPGTVSYDPRSLINEDTKRRTSSAAIASTSSKCNQPADAQTKPDAAPDPCGVDTQPT